MRRSGWQYEEGGKNTEEFLDQLRAAAQNGPIGSIETTGNTFSGPACNAIAAVLAEQGHLSVALMSNMFTQRKIPEIHPALSRFTEVFLLSNRLAVLDLSDNALNLDGAKAICPLLKRCMTLKELYLHNTGLGPYGGTFIADALLEACQTGRSLGTPYKLERFVLGRSRLETSGMQLAKALAAIGTLVEVQIPQNGLNDDAMVALFKAMACNPNLEILNLSDNHGGHFQGGRAAARALKACTKLRVVKVNDLTFGEKGGLALAEGLKAGCPLLEILDAMNNDFSPKVGHAMVEALGGKTRLRWANLHCNSFGDEALEALLQSLGDKTPSLDSSEEYEDYYDPDENEGPEDGPDVPFVDIPEREFFKDVIGPPVALTPATPFTNAVVSAAPTFTPTTLAAPAPTVAARPVSGSIASMFANLGVSTPTELDRVNHIFVHLRLLIAESGGWAPTSDADLIAAWSEVGGGKLAPAVGALVRGFANDAALRQRGLHNRAPYLSGSAVDSARLKAIA
jgi:Ran GTPase-activating protein 1